MPLDYTNLIICTKSDKFVGISKNNTCTNIVSSFEKINDYYSTNMTIPHNRAYRIQQINNFVEDISNYNIFKDGITFDCVSKIPQDVFQEYPFGMVQFESYFTMEEGIKIVEIEPVLLVNRHQLKKINIEITDYISQFNDKKLRTYFKTYKSGFTACTTNDRIFSIYTTVKSDGSVGKINHYDKDHIIFKLFKVFNIENNEIKIKDYILEKIDIPFKNILIKISGNHDSKQESILTILGSCTDEI
jgi:hypothetical protein